MSTDKQKEVRSTVKALSTERALKLALEALKLSSVTVDSFVAQKKTQEAITAIETLASKSEALAHIPSEREQPAQQDELQRLRALVRAQQITIEKLEAQQQEPVCDKDPLGCWSIRCQLGKMCKNTPPANANAGKPWVGLTDEEIEQCMKQAYATVQGRNLEHAFAHAIEAKLRERNEHREKNS